MALSFTSLARQITERSDPKLKSLPAALLETGCGNGKGIVPTEFLVLSEALFVRAPEDFMGRTSLPTLANITKEFERLYRLFAESGRPFLIEWINPAEDPERARFTCIYSFIFDRPFVVDSISEFLHTKGIRHHVLIHPVINDGIRDVSLTYIEIDRIDDPERLRVLSSEMDSIFANLLLMTDHFEAMAAAAERVSQDFRDEAARERKSDGTAQEISEFFTWLNAGNFVYLGCREWEEKGGEVQAITGHDFGIFLSKDREVMLLAEESRQEALHLSGSTDRMIFSRSRVDSPVHRRTNLEIITAKVMGSGGSNAGSVRYFSIVGMLSSQTVNQNSVNIPLLRRKLKSIIDAEGFPNTISYDYKEAVSFFNAMPKTLLFQLNAEQLQADLRLMMGIHRRNEARVMFHEDALGRFITLIVVMPRERFSATITRNIQSFLEQRFQLSPDSLDYQLTVIEDSVTTVCYFVPMPENRSRIDLPALGQEITAFTRTWADKLFTLLAPKHGKPTASRLVAFYERAFPEEYRATASPLEAALDIQILESLQGDTQLDLTLSEVLGGERRTFDLRIYKRGEGLSLSALVPFAENIGFELLAEKLVVVSSQDTPWAAIHSLIVRQRKGTLVPDKIFSADTLNGLRAVFQQKAENDKLNSLLISPGLTVREIALLRTIERYLWQVKVFPTESGIIGALIENPRVVELIVRGFERKFDPGLGEASSPERQAAMAEIRESFLRELKGISLLAHDRALRAAWNVVDATVRTNYFAQKSLRIALKIDCGAITRMPSPRPLFETFVTSSTFEGVHLRGGKVARGGLRWSERPDDFRTEVLGLMKTQMVKNSIIVPVGAKGGFVLKPSATEAASLREAVVHNYREFIRSLLELADNRRGAEVLHPQNVVRHDPDDPYLVVAADKGTADLSDVANEIAVREFDFWLGDAFASGGSFGYSHKKYGITARGAWETTLRHFRELGIDVEHQTFTVTGIGDMSGDVFGNGLLLSRKALLVAAFDHREIFIDPNPDPEAAFEERSRLFNLARSKWSDYNPELLSAGGGVYSRDAKEIPLGPEAAARLGIEPGAYSGQALVRAILMAPADLLWNGGIGTYVKASYEENLSVPDRGNDDVRIDAKDLRAKILAEGGNLGMTQLGRVEYAQHGGAINTDAVDNSAGVNLSDVEVNLKILLSPLLQRGELSIENRNAFLTEVVEDVCNRVLVRNRLQSAVMSADLIRSKSKLNIFHDFIQFLERRNLIDRKGEFIPHDDEFARRALAKAGLTRPELAVYLAHAKMWAFETVLQSSLPDDPGTVRHLIRYFPAACEERFARELRAHPLRREIIATTVANAVVDRMGAVWIYRTMVDADAAPVTVIAAFLVAEAVLGTHSLSRKLFVVDRPGMQKEYQHSLLKVAGSIDRMVHWLLDHQDPKATLQDTIDRYSPPVQELLSVTEEVIPEPDLGRYQQTWHRLTEGGFPVELAQKVGATVYGVSYLEVAELALSSGLPLRDVARLYGDLAIKLQLSGLLELGNRIDSADPWEHVAVRSLISEIRSSVGELAKAIILEAGDASRAGFERYIARRAHLFERFQLNVQTLSERSLSVSTLVVFSRQLMSLRRPAP